MNLFYSDEIFYLQKYGGISRYFSEVIERIKKYPNTKVYIYKGLKGRLSRVNNALIAYRLGLNKFDIFHPTYYSYAPKRKKCIKMVVTVYDMIHELFFPGLINFRNDILRKRQAIMSADHIICISYNTKKDLQKIYSINDKSISVVYLGTPVVNNDFIERRSRIYGKPYLLYVGKRNGYKNFQILLTTFVLLNIKKDFDLICFGEEEFSAEEISEFRRLNLENSIRHIEGNDEILQAYYRDAELFVYPSLYEGFGLPVLEAMTFGCPVIASSAASLPEITGDAALLFSPDKPDELAICIQKIIYDKALRNYYIEKGWERAKDFSWDKTAQETYKVYQGLLN